MSDSCTHLDTIEHTELPDVRVCDACIAIGSTWVHLRLCTQCGVIRCCDDSPNRHATAHFHETGHPVIRSAQPGRGLVLVLRRRGRVSRELRGARRALRARSQYWPK